MNLLYTDDLSAKLTRRIEALKKMDGVAIHGGVARFWEYLNSSGLIIILEQAALPTPKSVKDIFTRELGLLNTAYLPTKFSISSSFKTEKEHISFAYLVLKHCVETSPSSQETSWGLTFSHTRASNPIPVGPDKAIELFSQFILEPIHDFLIESLDSQKILLLLLAHYKEKCEFFQKEALYSLWSSEHKQGEKSLASRLYEYLHGQGVNLTIESVSASGEVDIIAHHKTDHIVGDVKVFTGDKGYIAKGFRQIIAYMSDYNEASGYLVVYNTNQKQLEFNLSGLAGATPYLDFHGKKVFVVTINIPPTKTTASKLGKLAPITITSNDVLPEISKPETTDSDVSK
jgi:hypothetical protein